MEPEAAGPEILELYNHYYDRATFETGPTAAASLERLVRSAEPFRKTGCWLDLGYGEGALLAIAERHGWACHGSEVSPRALECGRQRGWRVTTDPSGDSRFEPATFDVVSMIEFLEHLGDPIRFLGDAARWLRPGGLLYLTTPNAKSLNARLLGLSWSVVSPPEHIVLWTVRALRRVVTEAGFRVIRVRSEGLNPSEILARIRRAGKVVAVDRNQSALALSEALSHSAVRRALKWTINAGLSTLRSGDTLKVWAVRC
jgi:SAM-dependent methyltransferase